jgi:hypothetical protein
VTRFTPSGDDRRRADAFEEFESWRHIRLPILMGSAAQAPRPASLAGATETFLAGAMQPMHRREMRGVLLASIALDFFRGGPGPQGY